MPDHIHILLRIHDRLPKHLGQYIRWFKLQCSDAYQALAASHPALAATHTSACSALAATHTSACSALAAVPASIPSASHTPASNTPCLFAKEYHDRILTGKNQLTHMVRYIQDNPRRLALKRANRDLFRIRQNVTIGNIPCTTLGNMFLAEYPQRQVLQCSRRLTPDQITALKEENETDTRPVKRAECLDRMNISRRIRMHQSTSWKVRLMTSRCCSFESLWKLTA